MMKNTLIFGALIIIILAGAYLLGTKRHTTAINDNSSVSTLVYQFGSTIQKVSISGPDARSNIGAAYSPYVTADLLAEWQANPPFAPGKAVSSPWPDRIQIDSMTENNDGYTVKGTVIEVTSKEVTQGGIAATYPVTMQIKKSGNQWLIASYDRGPEVIAGTKQ